VKVVRVYELQRQTRVHFVLHIVLDVSHKLFEKVRSVMVVTSFAICIRFRCS